MKHLIYLLIFLFLLSCTSNTMYKKPEDLIPKDSLVLLLTDMYIAASAKNSTNKVSKKKNNYMPFVYDRYKIDSNRFHTSNNYYTSKIEDYNEVLSKVKANIEKKYKIFETAFNLEDSLRKRERKEKRRKIKLRDSLSDIREFLRKEDFIPFILEKAKIDTARFYENNDFYFSYRKEYNLILNKRNAFFVNKEKKDSIELMKLRKIKENLKKYQEE